MANEPFNTFVAGVVDVGTPGSGDLIPIISGGTTKNVTPAELATFVGVPVGANPTATVGPTVVNGTATTYTRSDGAPAINLTASYTWTTGTHTFNGVIAGTAVSTYLASPPAIGGTLPAAGSFTTIATSAAITTSVNAIAVTSTDGVVLQNTTAATNGTQQWSPRVHWIAQGYATTPAASQACEWKSEIQSVQGAANPTCIWRLASSINGSSFLNQISVSANGGGTTFAGVVAATGVDVTTAGAGLSVKEGSNCKQGTATLSGGTVTVANSSVTANSRIFLTAQSLGTVAVPSAYGVSARTAGTSFTILASAPTDTSVVAYEIFEPG